MLDEKLGMIVLVGSIAVGLGGFFSPASAQVYTDHVNNCKASIAEKMGKTEDDLRFNMTNIKSKSKTVQLRFSVRTNEDEKSRYQCVAGKSSGEVAELTELS